MKLYEMIVDDGQIVFKAVRPAKDLKNSNTFIAVTPGIFGRYQGNAYKMTTSQAFKLFFTRAFDFNGRSSRKEFWLGVLPNAIIMLALIGLLVYSLAAFETAINPFSIAMIAVFALFCLAELIPSVSLIFRRMRDIGKSGKYICVLLIPVIGFIWYIYLVTRPSNYYKK